MRWCVCSLYLGCLGGCVPFAMAPIKGEVGGATRLTDEDKATLHAAAGAHLASATTLPFDVGAGWTMDRAETETSHGAYVDAAYFVDRTDVSRASVGARAEVRWLDEGRVALAKLRFDSELYRAGAGEIGHDCRGTYHGVASIGVFIEAGRAWASEGADAWVASVGLAFRLPAVAGVWTP